MKKFILNRLKEASTWRALVALATAFGLYLTPEQTTAIVTLGLAVMGGIGAFFPDHIRGDNPQDRVTDSVPDRN